MAEAHYDSLGCDCPVCGAWRGERCLASETAKVAFAAPRGNEVVLHRRDSRGRIVGPTHVQRARLARWAGCRKVDVPAAAQAR